METKKIEEQLKSAVYVVVGAAATLVEKAKELATDFEEKGKSTCEKCEINNEELKHNFKDAINKVVNVTVVKEESTDDEDDDEDADATEDAEILEYTGLKEEPVEYAANGSIDYSARLEKIITTRDKIERDLAKVQKAILKYERTERRREKSSSNTFCSRAR